MLKIRIITGKISDAGSGHSVLKAVSSRFDISNTSRAGAANILRTFWKDSADTSTPMPAKVITACRT